MLVRLRGLNPRPSVYKTASNLVLAPLPANMLRICCVEPFVARVSP